jgi:hypothetical protein
MPEPIPLSYASAHADVPSPVVQRPLSSHLIVASSICLTLTLLLSGIGSGYGGIAEGICLFVAFGTTIGGMICTIVALAMHGRFGAGVLLLVSHLVVLGLFAVAILG